MVEIIAHRGNSFEYPENTLVAIAAAWREQADAVEGDFQLTADGQIVCLHDENTLRTTGVSQLVSAATLAELRRCDAGSWKNPAFASEQIPTLVEALGTTPLGRSYYVELKSGVESIAPLRRALAELAKPVDWIGISFYPDVVVALRAAFPTLPIWLIVERKRQSREWWPTAVEMIQFAVEHRLNGLDLDAASVENAEFVQQLHAAGLKVAVWTVDDPIEAQRLVACGVDAITTNRPGWLRQQLTAHGP